MTGDEMKPNKTKQKAIRGTVMHWIGLKCTSRQSTPLQWNGMECNGMEWNAMQCNGMQYNAIQSHEKKENER
jgi:hypothetical protein